MKFLETETALLDAVEFLVAGGTVTLGEWDALPAEQRTLLAYARKVLDAPPEATEAEEAAVLEALCNAHD